MSELETIPAFFEQGTLEIRPRQLDLANYLEDDEDADGSTLVLTLTRVKDGVDRSDVIATPTLVGTVIETVIGPLDDPGDYELVWRFGLVDSVFVMEARTKIECSA
jgi:hypothetical protein